MSENTTNASSVVAVVGAGPVGLAAACHLLARGEQPLVLEAGDGPGDRLALIGVRAPPASPQPDRRPASRHRGKPQVMMPQANGHGSRCCAGCACTARVPQQPDRCQRMGQRPG